jgi:hypothetical protein
VSISESTSKINAFRFASMLKKHRMSLTPYVTNKGKLFGPSYKNNCSLHERNLKIIGRHRNADIFEFNKATETLKYPFGNVTEKLPPFL